MIPGRATAEGTARYRARFAGSVAEGHFRRAGDLWLSSIGLGTYLGDADDDTDRRYEESIVEAAASGCNVFDAAINYRHQRSERALGRALGRIFDQGLARRDEIFVSTKAGFLPFDGEQPADPGAYLRRTYLDSGLLGPGDVAAGCHAMAPAYLEDQLERSRTNLDLETVDLFYLHNPETQVAEIGQERFAERFRAAADTLEGSRHGGRIGAWGVATWNAFRVPRSAPERLDLAGLAEIAPATEDGGGLRAVQLPLNLAMPEALLQPTQSVGGTGVPTLALGRELGLAVFTSASILQGRLARGLPAAVGTRFPGLEADAQRALQFTRSAPGVTAALVGMSRREHVSQNLALARHPPAGPETYRDLFGDRNSGAELQG